MKEYNTIHVYWIAIVHTASGRYTEPLEACVRVLPWATYRYVRRPSLYTYVHAPIQYMRAAHTFGRLNSEPSVFFFYSCGHVQCKGFSECIFRENVHGSYELYTSRIERVLARRSLIASTGGHFEEKKTSFH